MSRFFKKRCSVALETSRLAVSTRSESRNFEFRLTRPSLANFLKRSIDTPTMARILYPFTLKMYMKICTLSSLSYMWWEQWLQIPEFFCYGENFNVIEANK